MLITYIFQRIYGAFHHTLEKVNPKTRKEAPTVNRVQSIELKEVITILWFNRNINFSSAPLGPYGGFVMNIQWGLKIRTQNTEHFKVRFLNGSDLEWSVPQMSI